jgi:hypothetical protein
MGTVLDSHFLVLTALVTVSESLAPPPPPSFAVSFSTQCIYQWFHFGVRGGGGG